MGTYGSWDPAQQQRYRQRDTHKLGATHGGQLKVLDSEVHANYCQKARGYPESVPGPARITGTHTRHDCAMDMVCLQFAACGEICGKLDTREQRERERARIVGVVLARATTTTRIEENAGGE